MGNTTRAGEDTLPPDEVEVEVENLGGIDHCRLTLTPGVTVLEGRNATNRTSFLRALGGALGGDTVTIKRDADEGRVTATTPDTTVERVYQRSDDGVTISGEPYTTESTLIEYFACLLEDNPIRRGVERGGGGLRDIVMEPVDTNAIQDEIHAVRRERNEVEAQIEEIERQRDRLPSLREREQATERELEDVTAKLESLRESIPEADDRDDDGVLPELDNARTELASLRERVDRERDSLDAIRSERADLEDRLASHDVDEDRIAALEDRIDSLRTRRRRVADTIDELTAVVEFNERLLDAGPDHFQLESDGGVVEDTFDPASDTIECWTCGSVVDRDAIAETVGGIRDLLADHRTERQELATELEHSTEELSELRDRQERRKELSARLSELDREIERRERRLDRIQERMDDQRTTVSELEAQLTATDSTESELAERYRKLSELEYERGRLERERAALAEEIADLEAAGAEQEHLEAHHDELTTELARLRSRIDDLESETVAAFNDHVAELIDVLDYHNISRVWLERIPGSEQTTFDLHIVRTTEDGTVYEDDVSTLSESERKLIGLVLALAGYRVHDVHEVAPVMLLDSLEAIDGDRIATLVDYFADYAAYLVVALLPEDAARLPDGYEHVDASVLDGTPTA